MADDADPSGKLTASSEMFPHPRLTSSGPPDEDHANLDPDTRSDVDGTEAAYDMHAASSPEYRAPSAAEGHRGSEFRWALAFGLAVVLGMGALAGWLGYRTLESREANTQRALFLEVAKQGAVNLTTIDYQRADADVQRILDSSTGTFYDDFRQRSQQFIDVIEQAQSKSRGDVTEAGLESGGSDLAQVLVAVAVTTSTAGTVEQQPRLWRMRINVHEVGDSAKVSNVEFVP